MASTGLALHVHYSSVKQPDPTLVDSVRVGAPIQHAEVNDEGIFKTLPKWNRTQCPTADQHPGVDDREQRMKGVFLPVLAPGAEMA